jgi:hypothetical protein
LTLPLAVPLNPVRLVLLAVSVARVVVGAIVTLPLETKLAGEATDAVSGVEAAAAVELGITGEVEALDPDPVAGFV